MRALLLGLSMLAGLAPGGARAATGETIAVGDATRTDLSAGVEWCESGRQADIDQIAAGGCRFARAMPGDLARGYSRRAFWLRLTLANSGAAPAERWLRIGHPRLEHVSFFEAVAGGWRRSDAGLAVPADRRQMMTVDPILALRLAPGERRTILVRVASDTSIDLTPTLWQPNAYVRHSTQALAIQALGAGGMMVVAILSLLIWVRGREALYLYYGLGGLAKTAFMTGFTGLWPAFLWPAGVPFDIRLLAVAAGALTLLFVLFVRRCVGEYERYRIAHAMLLGLGGLTLVATLWACLIEYRAVGFILLLSTAVIILSTFLFWHTWRRGNRAAGLLFWAYSIILLTQVASIAVNFGGAGYSNLFASIYTLGFLLSAPLVLFGLAVQSEELHRRLALAQAENAARVDFLARMSHELRTPLDTILGTAQLLTQADVRIPLATGLADITHSGWRLLRMIDEILDYVRGLAGRLAILPVATDWRVLLRSVELNARLLAERNGNAFSLREDGTAIDRLRIDEGRLRQVLDNLLVNAARHTRNGWIRLDCDVRPSDERGRLRLDFAVADSGEGIAPEDMQRIFRPFERGGENARQGGKGIGMGLAIARQLVETMGGELTVESAPGQGACFRFHILAEPAETPVLETSEPSATGYAGKRQSLLLVEDEAGNRNIVATLLRVKGFAVTEAESGEEAADLCAGRAEPFDLVLTDQFMADGDGWSVLEAVAKLWPGVPVVLLSAAPPERPAGFPAKLDFAAQLLKPLDHDKLLRLIGELLGLAWRETPTASATAAATVARDHRPSATDLTALRGLIDTGQVTGIVEWAEELAVREPRCAPFAAAVRTAARGLDFPQLNALAGDAG